MKPARFDYLRPATVADAVAALAATRDDEREAKVLAGGQSLGPLLAMRLAAPGLLVDLGGLPELAGVHAAAAADADVMAGSAGGGATPGLHGGDGPGAQAGGAGSGWLRVGAMTRHRDLRAAPHPLAAEAAGWIGHTAIRARGTIGGSLAHADPNAEWPAVALACDARLHLTGPAGVRTVGADGFFHGLLQTDLADDEILTAVDLAQPRRWGFAELARRHGDFALVLVAVAELADGWRVVLGGVAGTPVRCPEAEALLDAGGVAGPDPAAVAAAVATAPESAAFTDLHATAAYRRALAAELTARALADLQTGAAAAGSPADHRPSVPPAGLRPSVPVGFPPAEVGPAGFEPVAAPRARLAPVAPVAAAAGAPAGTVPPAAGAAVRAGTVGGVLDGAAVTPVTLLVNGRRVVTACEPRHTLADVLREQLGLTGTHLGCEQGVCGACTVLVDGEPVRACLTFAVQLDAGPADQPGTGPGPAITTIEGLAGPASAPGAEPALHPVQEAFSRCHGLQCGYCTPGFVLTAVHLLATSPHPDRATIRTELSGNLCRCTGYTGIVDAVESAATGLADQP